MGIKVHWCEVQVHAFALIKALLIVKYESLFGKNTEEKISECNISS